ncbi:ankyrin repeat-containing domain protein [Aspergillus egyptiacus]|nr:ankyrin repeat-containing domain protein [Aspergillus egyptiacus]
MSEQLHLDDFPVEVLDLVARHLSTPSLAALSQVSSIYRDVVKPVIHSIHDDEELEHAIEYAAENDREDLLLDIFQRPVSLRTLQASQARQFDALVYSCGNGFIDTVQFLLGHGISADPDGSHVAAYKPHKARGWTTPLMAAVRRNRGDVVQALLNAGADLTRYDFNDTLRLIFAPRSHPAVCQELVNRVLPLNVVDDNSDSLLHAACMSHSVQNVQFLLDNNFDPNSPNNTGVTPIGRAIQAGRYYTVQHLLDNGVSANSVCDQLYFPIHVAAAYGSPAVVSLLLERGADVNQPTARGHTPLYALAENNTDPGDILRVLLGAGVFLAQNPASTFHFVRTALTKGWWYSLHQILRAPADHLVRLGLPDLIFIAAAAMGNVDLLRQALESSGPFQGARVSVDGNFFGTTALIEAARHGRSDAVKFLIHEAKVTNFDVVDDGTQRTALHWAILQRKEDIFLELLPYGMLSNARDAMNMTPFEQAVRNLDPRLLTRLMDRFETLNLMRGELARTYLFALHLAAQWRSLDIVQTLVTRMKSRGLPVATPIQPLFLSITTRRIDTAVYLIQQGISLHQSPSGISPFFHACILGQVPTVQAFIDLSIAIDAPNASDMTALMVASINGRSQVARQLIQAGANVRRVSSRGDTPLRLAVRAGCEETIQILLDAGAVPDAQCLQIAARHGDANILRALLAFGGNVDINSAPAPFNRTPIYLAANSTARATAPAAVKILIAHGADVNKPAPAPSRRAPLACAVLAGCIERVTLLLEAGADPNYVEYHDDIPPTSTPQDSTPASQVAGDSGSNRPEDQIGWTAAAYAASTGKADMLRLLAAYGAKLYDSLLHICAAGGWIAACRFLLEAGLDPLSVDREGRTPLEVVPEGANDEMIMLLYSYM